MMDDVRLCVYGLPHAFRVLQSRGIRVEREPNRKTTHLLLPVPVFDVEKVQPLLQELPSAAVLLGGNLTHPLFQTHRRIDLLQDELYLAENAALTAVCAMRLAGQILPVRLAGLPVLIVGWGRIGKCLARQLRLVGAQVSVAARKERDRALISALGYGALSMEEMVTALPGYRVIFNTVPAPVLTQTQLASCGPDCVKIDLASLRGMDSADVIHARGLPGKMLPESSGQLIADSVLRLLEKEGKT